MRKKSLRRTSFFLPCIFLMLLIIQPKAGSAQNAGARKVTGKITAGTTNESLAGVSVRTKDADIGTTTSIDGTFSLQVKAPTKHSSFPTLDMKPGKCPSAIRALSIPPSDLPPIRSTR